MRAIKISKTNENKIDVYFEILNVGRICETIYDANEYIYETETRCGDGQYVLKIDNSIYSEFMSYYIKNYKRNPDYKLMLASAKYNFLSKLEKEQEFLEKYKK